jgi:predicted ferric reductase
MMLALATPKFVWYLMRGSGMVALVLFTMTTVLGVVGVSRWETSRWPRLVTGSLHRNLSLLALCFLGLHVATALVDQWVGLNWIGAVVPFVSTYRPLWVGMGVVAADLLLAVMATSLLRRHIGFTTWRFVHWGAWLMWPLAVAHAFGSGTDTTKGWGLVLALACVGVVVAAAIYRFANAAIARNRIATGTPATTLVTASSAPHRGDRRDRRDRGERGDDRRLVSSGRPR